jgi:phosphohistidine swiveling domain-containing protein/uncharacterized membrane protein (DUF106 family)
MIPTPRFTQELSECSNTLLAGGKAANLGRLLRAGFAVPDGFVVTTRAYDCARTPGAAPMPAEVAEEIRIAYRLLGRGLVAVRSSATAEDMAGASMAGQYETFLNIEGESALLKAVRRCWASLDAPRVQAYLREHGIEGPQSRRVAIGSPVSARVAMAVIVQRLVPADVAGVLFTTNPHDGRTRDRVPNRDESRLGGVPQRGIMRWGPRAQMLLEASWGLGEMVVSGRVQPDVLRLEQDTGRVLEATIADKHVRLAAGAADEDAVEESCHRKSCLSGRDVYRLWQLGRHVAQYLGCPQDIEWAIQGDELYLLQSRPITTLSDIEAYDEVLRTTKRHLLQETAAGHGPWVLHNLAETVPHPTPLTWSILKRFMSGAGGFGAMYRQAGFEPSAVVCQEGFLECLAGRIYMDAARAPEMLFPGLPFAYDLEELKRNPDASQTPPTVPPRSAAARRGGSVWTQRRAGRRLPAVTAALHASAATLEHDLRDRLFQEVAAAVASAKRMDLNSLSTDQLLTLWGDDEGLVLDTFGPRLLMPGLIAAMAVGELRAFLQETLWDEDVDTLTQILSAGGEPDRTMPAAPLRVGDAYAELSEVAKGHRSLETWLAQHGHRAAGEFDLAQPRWREQPAAVREMAHRLAAGEGPSERHRRNAAVINQRLASLRARLTKRQRWELDRLVSLVRRHITLREDSKDFLMLGYDLLRDLALEAGRRLDLADDVFYLTREELFEALRVGFAPYHLIEQRKRVYRAETRLTLPRVIDAAAIDTLGATPELMPTAGGYQALAVSAGQAQGRVTILHSPTEAGDLGQGCILVCPSTDPSWTPLFVHAAGLVLECGGILSHGAVVARELGLPAVVLPGATRLFSEEEPICVDGSRGWVGSCGSTAAGLQTPAAGTDDVSIARVLLPPPAGRKDRQGARLSRRLALVWAVYLMAFFLLPPQYVYQPTLRVLDVVSWPLACTLGKPAVVAIVAAAVAVLTLLVQRLATDNRRLREAKQRAAGLRKQARLLPKDSPQRARLIRLAAGVQMRTLAAAMIPVGILLGPMVMPFVWFRERVDPATWNAPAGSAVQIVATVDSDWSEPVRIGVPAPVVVDDSTPVSRTLLPLRATLERLLALYRQPRNDPGQPWELKLAPDLGREQTANDLQAYLEAGISPQGITWLIRPPGDMGGRFSVTVTAGEHAPVVVDVVLGDKYPPAPRRVMGPVGSPVRELQVVYPRSRHEEVFWRPLARLADCRQVAWATRLAAVEVGWLWLYILVYLPALVLARAVLKVA